MILTENKINLALCITNLIDAKYLKSKGLSDYCVKIRERIAYGYLYKIEGVI